MQHEYQELLIFIVLNTISFMIFVKYREHFIVIRMGGRCSKTTEFGMAALHSSISHYGTV